MTSNITTENLARADVAGRPESPARPAPSRHWAVAGIASGAAAIGMVVASGMVSAVYDPDHAGDAEAIRAELAEMVPQMLAFHVFGVVSALLLVVFAAGLYRRLRATMDPDSLVPAVSAAGLIGTAVVTVLGTGLDTEFIFGLADPDMLLAENATFFNHWIGTIPWVWVLAGLAGVGLFVAGRAGAVPRWIGLTGLVLGGLTLVLGISPLQYMAGMTAPLWLLITAVGFVVGDRAHRA